MVVLVVGRHDGGAAGGGGLGLGRQVKVMTGILDWLHRGAWRRGAGRASRSCATLEDTIYGFHRRHPERLCPVLALEAAYHAAGVAEVFVTLAWIATPPTLLVAFILETANRLTNVVFKFVPMRLGVDEAGTALLTRSSATRARPA